MHGQHHGRSSQIRNVENNFSQPQKLLLNYIVQCCSEKEARRLSCTVLLSIFLVLSRQKLKIRKTIIRLCILSIQSFNKFVRSIKYDGFPARQMPFEKIDGFEN